jgi:hypothetical protein
MGAKRVAGRRTGSEAGCRGAEIAPQGMGACEEHRGVAARLAVAAAVLGGCLALGTPAQAGNGGTGLPGGGGSHHHHHHHHRHRRPYRPRSFAPPRGRIYHGVSETTEGVKGVRRFADQVGAHPAVVEDFFNWGVPLATGALHRWRRERARGALSLSTAPGGGAEMITPRQIAQGQGDHYLIRLNQSISAAHETVYIRPMAEMNSFYNPYSAFNSDGSKRRGHTTNQFVEAWRRMAIVVRGGTIASINSRLRRMGLPRLMRAKSNLSNLYREENIHHHRLRHPRVAFMWNPQTVSNPSIRANAPSKYWPGRKYVDWVGADIYSSFASPGIKSALRRFQHRYRRYPFFLGEYGPWDNDYRGRFTKWLFRWERRHKQVRMAIYYRSTRPHSAYAISHYAGARHKLRKILDANRFEAYAPGLRPHRH